jgi:hypothetical protein
MPTRRRNPAVIDALNILDEATRLTACAAVDVDPGTPVVRLAQFLQLTERLRGGRLYFDRGKMVLDYGVAKIRTPRRRGRLWRTLAVFTRSR